MEKARSAIENEIIDEFDLLDDWMSKYDHIISLGKELPAMNPLWKISENEVAGCQSKVWLHAEAREGNVYYWADSDAIITKGMMALLLRVIQNRPAEEIAREPFAFLDAIGLVHHLSPSRANGLLSMVKQIKFYALAFSAKTK